jgi:hypothetical protein
MPFGNLDRVAARQKVRHDQAKVHMGLVELPMALRRARAESPTKSILPAPANDREQASGSGR